MQVWQRYEIPTVKFTFLGAMMSAVITGTWVLANILEKG